MKKRNIYQNRSQELFHLFEKAGNNSKVMCVPIDYAKKDHVAMFCNGYGDILRKPFNVKNSPEGVKYLTAQTMRSCRHRHIKKEHVFFGGEDVNSYAQNFVSTLRTKGWLVANVNAHDAKKQRDNLQASTDRLDLMVPLCCSTAGRTAVRHRSVCIVICEPSCGIVKSWLR